MIIRRLDRPTQARLVMQVVQELADEPDSALRRSHAAWARLAELREEFRRLGSISPSAGEQRELDRQQRADLLAGKIRAYCTPLTPPFSPPLSHVSGGLCIQNGARWKGEQRMTTTLDAVQQLVDQLSPLEQVQLITHLTQRLASALSDPVAPAPGVHVNERWAQLDAFWKTIEDLGSAAPSVTEQLFADRHNRQMSLENPDHVHS